MPLTDTAVRNAKKREKPYKMGDALGLFLLVQPSDGKLWRFKYRFDGREKKLGLGNYPSTSLADPCRTRSRGCLPGFRRAACRCDCWTAPQCRAGGPRRALCGRDFRDHALLAANLGDDTDTTAAITGQVAGALYGASGVPAKWLGRLAWRERIAACADALVDAA